MKFTLLAALSTLALVAASPAEPRGATVSSAEEFYFPSRNITCHHAGENGVQCENGHLRDAQVYQALDTTEAKEARSLKKRLSCVNETICWTHCFAIGYCNAYCDKGVCHCSCMDKTPWWKVVPCIKTSCN